MGNQGAGGLVETIILDLATGAVTLEVITTLATLKNLATDVFGIEKCPSVKNLLLLTRTDFIFPQLLHYFVKSLFF